MLSVFVFFRNLTILLMLLLLLLSSLWQVGCQGVDVDSPDGDGATPLHFAASRGHADVVRWLLARGARVTLDNFGKSPLNDAAESEQLEVRGRFMSRRFRIASKGRGALEEKPTANYRKKNKKHERTRQSTANSTIKPVDRYR